MRRHSTDLDPDTTILGDVDLCIESGTVRIRWMYADDPEDLVWDLSAVRLERDDDTLCLDPDADPCDRWCAEAWLAAGVMWAAIRPDVERRIALPRSEPLVGIERSDPEAGAGIIAWSWRRDGTCDPLLLALIPDELIHHMPCRACDTILHRLH